MRILALAAAVGIGMAMSGAAYAGPWSDPNGRINFTAPNGWQIDPENNPTSTVALSFDGGHDCYLIGLPNNVTANASVEAVNRTMTPPITAASWLTTANSIREFFPDNSAQVTSQTVDTSGFWPVQRAEFSSPEGTVYGSLQSRPGVDLIAFCRALGRASTAPFEAVFASINHPNDAAWRAAAEQRAAEREAAAAAAAAAPPPAEQPEENTRRRRNN